MYPRTGDMFWGMERRAAPGACGGSHALPVLAALNAVEPGFQRLQSTTEKQHPLAPTAPCKAGPGPGVQEARDTPQPLLCSMARAMAVELASEVPLVCGDFDALCADRDPIAQPQARGHRLDGGSLPTESSSITLAPGRDGHRQAWESTTGADINAMARLIWDAQFPFKWPGCRTPGSPSSRRHPPVG